MFFVSLIPFVHFTVAKLFVEVLDSSQTVVYRCDANGADFGGEISSLISKNSSIGCLHKVRPALACSSVQVPTTNSSDCATNFALVQRGDCCFSQKTWHSQKAGFMAMIVANNEGEAPMMMGSGGSADLVKIPSLLISHASSQTILKRFPVEKGYLIKLIEETDNL